MSKTTVLPLLLMLILVAKPSLGGKSNEIDEDQSDKVTYSTKYDNVDLEEILRSDRLLQNYVNCLLEKAKCTPDGSELKQNLPEAINDDCRKCSETQRIGSARVMHYIIDNKPDWWEELEQKYNPDGSYKRAYLMSTKKDDSEDREEEEGKKE